MRLGTQALEENDNAKKSSFSCQAHILVPAYVWLFPVSAAYMVSPSQMPDKTGFSPSNKNLARGVLEILLVCLHCNWSCEEGELDAAQT